MVKALIPSIRFARMETNFFFPAPDSFHRNCDSHHLASGSGHYFPSPFSEGNFPDINCKPGGDADHEGTRPGSGQGQDRWGVDLQVEAYHASQYSQSKFKIVNSPLQVAGSVSLTWVQPRVLDATQVMISWSCQMSKPFYHHHHCTVTNSINFQLGSMLDKIGGWVSSVGSMEVKICLLYTDAKSMHTIHVYFTTVTTSFSGPHWKQGWGDPHLLDRRTYVLLFVFDANQLVAYFVEILWRSWVAKEKQTCIPPSWQHHL